MIEFNVLSLFDGISCCQQALNNAGINYTNYFSSEINSNTIKVTQKNFPNTIQVGDIKNWEDWGLPKIDFIAGGSPCQGFSHSGLGLNFEDHRSKLFFDFIKVLDALTPKYFLFENVRMKKEWSDIITNYLGVDPVLINSNIFVPQSRTRLYWTNIPIEKLPESSNKVLLDILQDNVEQQYYLTEKQLSKLNLNFKWTIGKSINYKAGKHQQDTIYRYDGIMGCLSAATHGAARHLTKTYLPSGSIRRLTEIECERLQGLPDNYTEGISSSSRYEAIGNGWTVPVISHIIKNLK